MPFDIFHPSCILKVMLFACNEAHEPLYPYCYVHPAWYDAIEPFAASAVILKLGITRTPKAWLKNNQLEQFDATPLFSIQAIGPSFMADSRKLKSVDFSGTTFDSVIVIEDYFLYHCPALERVDLSSLRKVMGIARGFLSGCSSLKEIDLGFAANVDEILAEFLNGTSSLTSIDVSPIAQLEYFADSFLSNASSLVEIRGLENFHNMKSIDYGLFLNCSSLKSIDVSFLKNLTTIPDSFLRNCSSLEKIDGMELLTQVRELGQNFCLGCKCLKEIDFSGIGTCCITLHLEGFLDECTSLVVIDLRPLAKVTEFVGRGNSTATWNRQPLKFKGVVIDPDAALATSAADSAPSNGSNDDDDDHDRKNGDEKNQEGQEKKEGRVQHVEVLKQLFVPDNFINPANVLAKHVDAFRLATSKS